jgi:hypothetical protein
MVPLDGWGSPAGCCRSAFYSISCDVTSTHLIHFSGIDFSTRPALKSKHPLKSPEMPMSTGLTWLGA